MNANDLKRTSKFLSYILRHHPDEIGIQLDEAGWVSVSELLAGAQKHNRRLTREQIETVVADNDKQRFELSSDGESIRARQGHSVSVDLGYAPAEPPETLLHGTAKQFLSSIREQGLLKGQRHHVHMHADRSVATAVGGRRGKAVLLEIDARRMHADGHQFFVTENNVWLTEHVPPNYLRFP